VGTGVSLTVLVLQYASSTIGPFLRSFPKEINIFCLYSLKVILALAINLENHFNVS
jgi:hypothetical protein